MTTSDRRLIHASSNGDRWWLCRGEGGEGVVLHEPNAPSGGRASRIALGAFLGGGAAGPEHRALLHLIGTLVADAPAPAAPEPGAAAAEPTPGEALG